MFRFCSMARLEEEKKRSVRSVPEQFSTTNNEAMGQKMNVWGTILIVFIIQPFPVFRIFQALADVDIEKFFDRPQDFG